MPRFHPRARKRSRDFPFSRILRQRFILYFDNRSSLAVPPETDFYRWLWQALKPHCRRAHISLMLFDEEQARSYNRDYRGKDYATNVLSFESGYDHTDTLQGDLIICPQVVLREAAEQGKTPTAHFAHLAIHGALHLLGYDHLNDNDAEIMEALEIRTMAQLGFANPYVSTHS